MKPYSSKFYFKTRPDGSQFVKLPDDETELRDLVRAIHFDCFDGCLPDDWIYKQTMYAFEALEDIADEEEAMTVMDNIEADPYRHALLEWAKSSYTSPYIEEALCLNGQFSSIEGHLTCAQYLAIRAIYQKVWGFIQNKKEVSDEPRS